MNEYIFTANSMTCNGKTFPADYSLLHSGAVMVLVTVEEQADRVQFRIKPDHPNFAAALAAAKEARKGPAAEPIPEPAAAPIEAPAADPIEEPAPVEEPAAERDPKQTRGPVPEKTFIGDSIQGKGWNILFDAETSRTRVIFDKTPSKAARAAVEKAGFYFSAAMNSWNKKLTFKAYRAAQALSGELQALRA